MKTIISQSSETHMCCDQTAKRRSLTLRFVVTQSNKEVGEEEEEKMDRSGEGVRGTERRGSVVKSH